ncbi:ORF6N domain-containing protein [Oligoflexia bacterium]|nr:ORF6N domain-containing protein [Oligoflexia bacterium]
MKELEEDIVELRVEGLIYQIRGERVLLDQDLSQLYGVETKALVQAVKRNLERFPEDFMFQLSDQEFSVLRSQIVTSKGRGGRRSAPYAFTEQGVAMLSSVLRSNRAVRVNVHIMRTFVRLRKIFESHKELADQLIDLEDRHEKKFQRVFDAIRELTSEKTIPKKRRIGFGRGDET